jgi:hypothetical protein
VTSKSPWPKWTRRLPSPELANELAELFRKGHVPKTAAALVGIPTGRLNQWLREGEAELEELYDTEHGYPSELGMLYAMCARATAEYLDVQIGTVSDPKMADWRAAAWLIERRLEEFNPSSKLEIDSHSTQHVIVQHDPAAILAVLADAGLVAPALDPADGRELLPALADREAGRGDAGAEVPEPAQAG